MTPHAHPAQRLAAEADADLDLQGRAVAAADHASEALDSIPRARQLGLDDASLIEMLVLPKWAETRSHPAFAELLVELGLPSEVDAGAPVGFEGSTGGQGTAR